MTAFLIGAGFATAVLAVVAVVAGVQLRVPPAMWSKAPPGRVVMAVVSGVTVLVFTGIPVGALVGVALGWWVPGMVADARARRAGYARSDAITAWTRQVSDLMAGSLPITAIRASVKTAPAAIAAEVRQFDHDLTRMSFGDASQLFAGRLADADGEIIAAALNVANSSGGAAARVLAELAQAAADNADMHRRVDAARAGLDTRARIITGLFVVGFAGARVTSPSALAPFHSAVGQVVLLAVGAMFALSYVWLARMRRAERPGPILVRLEGATS